MIKIEYIFEMLINGIWLHIMLSIESKKLKIFAFIVILIQTIGQNINKKWLSRYFLESFFYSGIWQVLIWKVHMTGLSPVLLKSLSTNSGFDLYLSNSFPLVYLFTIRLSHWSLFTTRGDSVIIFVSTLSDSLWIKFQTVYTFLLSIIRYSSCSLMREK